MALVTNVVKMATALTTRVGLPLPSTLNTPKGRQGAWRKLANLWDAAVDEKRKRSPVLAATLFAARLGKANNGAAIYKKDQPLHVAMWPRVTSTRGGKLTCDIQETPDPVLAFTLSSNLSTLNIGEIEQKLRKLHPSVTRIVSVTELYGPTQADQVSDVKPSKTSHFHNRSRRRSRTASSGIPEEFVMKTRTLPPHTPAHAQSTSSHSDSDSQSESSSTDSISYVNDSGKSLPARSGSSLVMFAMNASALTRRELLHNLRFQLERDGSTLWKEFPLVDKDYGIQPVVNFDMDPSRLDEGEELLQKHAKESTVSGGLLTIHNSSNLPIKITVSEEDPDAAVHKNPAQLLAPIQRTSADSQEISSPQSSSRSATETSHTSDTEPGWERAQRFFASPGDSITLVTATKYSLVSILASDTDGQVFEPLRRRLQTGASIEFSERDVDAYRAFSGVLRC